MEFIYDDKVKIRKKVLKPGIQAELDQRAGEMTFIYLCGAFQQVSPLLIINYFLIVLINDAVQVSALPCTDMALDIGEVQHHAIPAELLHLVPEFEKVGGDRRYVQNTGVRVVLDQLECDVGFSCPSRMDDACAVGML